MATLAELEQRKSQLEAERRRLRALADLNGSLQSEIQALRVSLPTIADPVEQQRAQSRLDELLNEIGQARVRLAEISDELQVINDQISRLIFGTGSSSAGATVAQANQARDDGAQTQAPPVAAASAPSPSNAEPTPTDTIPPAQAAPPLAGSADQSQAATQTLPEVTVTATRLPPEPSVQLPEPQVRQTYYYKAISVTSTFSGGRFTQDIEGALLITPVRRVLPTVTPGTDAITSGGGLDAAVDQSGQFGAATGGQTGLTPPTGFDAASLGVDGQRLATIPTNVGNLVPVPPGIPPVSQIASAIPRLPSDPGVLAPAIRSLPTSGSTQIGLFSNAVNTNIGAGISSGTSDADLTYAGNDGIVWDRINAERLRRGLPGLAAIGNPRPPDDRASTQIATYQTQRET
jgi:hypothetical protein